MEPDITQLLARETATVEWKEGPNAEEVVETLTAFANDLAGLGGGHVLCGVRETRDVHGFRHPELVGLSARELHRLCQQVMAFCHEHVEPPITPDLVEVPLDGQPERRIVVFHVEASRAVHLYKGRYRVRVQDHTRVAAEADVHELFRSKQVIPFLEQPCPSATREDLDLLALEDTFRALSLPYEASHYLAPDEPIAATARPLFSAQRLAQGGTRAVPNRFAIVLFGREPTRFFPGAYTVFSVYDGPRRDAVHSQKFEVLGPLVRQIRDVLSRLQLYTGTTIDKSQSALSGRQNRPRYAEAALQEALVNALVHRDYEDREPTRITVFTDRIEFASPGGLLRQIDAERVKRGESGARWRNPSLAAFLVRTGLAQEEGQGIPTILRQTREIAGQEAVFAEEPGRFTVGLPARRSEPPPSPRIAPPLGRESPASQQRPGLILVSIGEASIRNGVTSSLEALGLSDGEIVMDHAAPGYVDTEADWRRHAEEIRDLLRQTVDMPTYPSLHLFYRGPVVLAPLIGALIPRAKSLTIYYYRGGRYFPAYTIDERFRKTTTS